MKRLRIGTRGSALALWQSRHVASLIARVLPGMPVDLVEISSLGDQVTDVPLSHVEGTGFFTASIERALLAREVDIAVHSYKDLPVEPTAGLVVAAVPQRGPVEDVLCGRNGALLKDLAPGARIGTCSTRRTAQIRMIRDDLEIVPLRGNVPTRVTRIAHDLDAIVLARAGLERLGLAANITEVFAIDRMLPAPAQGALAIQCREADDELLRRLAVLNDDTTRRAVDAERTMLHVLGGGCSVPVGALATIADQQIHLEGGVFSQQTLRAVRVTLTGPDPVDLGTCAAAALLDGGAGTILAEEQGVTAQ